MHDAESGELINVSHMIPKSASDLRRRAEALECLARYSVGFLGRTPDYVNVTTAGFAGRPDVFGMNGDTRAVEALRRFQREVALRDLALTHTIVHPVVDKAVDDLSGVNGELALRIVKRDERGIVVRGARLLATLGPFADELFVYPGQPLPKGADPAFAIAFSVPMATRGLITICRDHYAVAGATLDRPFSSRFDEQDAFVIFDDVHVPWERVFIAGDVEIYNRIMGSGWTANVDPRRDQARVRVRARDAHGRGAERGRSLRKPTDAGRDLVLLGADPRGAEGRRRRCTRLRGGHVVLRRSAVSRTAFDGAGVDGAHQ
jgi:4-hydroxyphenylacetate 3-monooxygenase/anthranilate 3-monooxygenase (FAD)/4-hydroxyphenylacetate 3-monooxygenase